MKLVCGYCSRYCPHCGFCHLPNNIKPREYGDSACEYLFPKAGKEKIVRQIRKQQESEVSE